VRLPAPLRESIARAAKTERRSFNGQTVILLEEAIAARSVKAKPRQRRS
jgi:hypothetical protein